MGDRHNLPDYSLFVRPADLNRMLRHPDHDEWYSARWKADGTPYRIDIALRGSHIRRYPKKSYHVRFRSPGLFQGARELHLNAEYADPSMIRNRLSFAFFERLGALAPQAKHVCLQVNGAQSGVYLQLESVDDLFLKKKGLPPGAIFYAVNDDANFSLVSSITNQVKEALEDGYEEKTAREEDWAFLRELVYVINTTPSSDFPREIERLVDLEAYWNWLIGVVCTQNFDGFVQNYALYRNGGTGRFQLIPWDYDGTWGRNLRGDVLRHDYIPIRGYNTLTARLLAVPEFRARYRRRMEEVLETAFTQQELEPLVVDLLQSLRPAWEADPYKKDSIHRLDEEQEVILRYIADRRRYLQDGLVELD